VRARFRRHLPALSTAPSQPARLIEGCSVAEPCSVLWRRGASQRSRDVCAPAIACVPDRGRTRIRRPLPVFLAPKQTCGNPPFADDQRLVPTVKFNCQQRHAINEAPGVALSLARVRA
jgi:hypothetical protein